MKSDIELQKCMIVQKAKGYPIKEKYPKAFSQWEMIVSKDQNDQMLWLKVELNVKLQVMLSSFVGGHIYIFL